MKNKCFYEDLEQDRELPIDQVTMFFQNLDWSFTGML